MSFKPLVATALVGALACGVMEARTSQLVTFTGWNGGMTIIGNMRAITDGVGGGRRITLNQRASNLEIVAQFINTNKNAYGMIFEGGSYSNVTFEDTTFSFIQLLSTSSMTGIYLKNNTMNLSFGSPENTDVLFSKRVYGRTSVAGFVADRSNLAIGAGTIEFRENVESDGVAYGLLSKNGTASRSYIRLSDGETTRRPSSIIKFNGVLQGREAYGIKFENNRSDNFLEIKQNANLSQAGKEAGGIYFNQIKGTGGNASLFRSDGNTSISISGKSVLRSNIVTSTQTSTLIAVNRGNASLTLNNGARLQANEVSSGNGAYGLNIVGFNGYADPSAYANVNVHNGSTLSIGRIYSDRSNAYGLQTDKRLTIDVYGDNSLLGFGTISSNMQGIVPRGDAYGIRGEQYTEIKAINGGQITFSSIQGSNAYGIRSSHSVILKPQGYGRIAFANIYAGGRQGERAVGIASEGAVIIYPNVAGKLIFENISSKSEANGIRTNNSVRVESGSGGSITFKNIQSQGHNAIGMYDPSVGLFYFNGNGSTTFERIEYTGNGAGSVYVSAGIIVDQYDTTLDIRGGHNLAFNNIISYYDAYGMRTGDRVDIITNNSGSLRFGTIRANNSAYGIKTRTNASLSASENSRITFSTISSAGKVAGISASSIQESVGRNSSIRFENINSSNNIAIGLEANSVSLTANNNGQIYFGNITSSKEANGIRVSNSAEFNLGNASGTDRIIFQQIRSQDGNAMGIYTYGNNANVSFNGSGSNVVFKDISHFGDSPIHFAGGIISEGAQLNLSVRNGNNVWLDKVASNSNAYGLRGNAMNIYIDSTSSLNIAKISARQNAYGILGYSRNITLSGGGVIKFGSITSTRASTYAIYTPDATLSIDNSSLFFGSKTDNDRYGIYNNINGLRYELGDTSIQITGNNATGFYAQREAIVNLGANKTLRFDTRAQNGGERASIGGSVNLTLGANSKLVFNSDAGTIKRLNVSNGANINLIGTNERSNRNLQLRKLVVESWNGSGANVLLYANGTSNIDTTNFDGRAYRPDRTMAWVGGSDKIVINSTSTSGQQNNTLKVALDTVDNPTKYVVLAEVGGNAKNSVIFNNLNGNRATTTIQTEVGFDIGNIEITRHDSGNTAYYVGKIPDRNSFRLNQQRARQVGSTQNASSSVTSANFNNLNKRMGELRENSHAHGLWARVFNGEVESSFDDASLTNYTTIQAGYDYNLSSDANSNSYLGFALSYLNSKTSSVASDTKGNGVEAGVYFAYVQDSGLYTDSILKLSYMSNTNSSSEYSLSDTNNTSFILSQEVGYEADIGAGFYLTPQFETTYAYLGGSSMTATMADGKELKSTQDATNNWRNRLGLQASYKLKGENESFLASFYAMGSYTYDYISGGDTTYESGISPETLSNPIKSDGRFVLNVGSNIDIKDATRLYLDFEKSFGGKINTNYQINVGVRYSFGEKISK